jgi:hypothetical protein
MPRPTSQEFIRIVSAHPGKGRIHPNNETTRVGNHHGEIGVGRPPLQNYSQGMRIQISQKQLTIGIGLMMIQSFHFVFSLHQYNNPQFIRDEFISEN